MATYDYTGLRATAERLITKYGQDVTLKRDTATGTDYDPTITTTTHAAEAAVMEFTNRERDGTLITVRDKKVFLSTKDLSVTPAVDDRLAIGGVDHEIVNVMPLNPGGTTLVYKMQVRN